jgi:integrase
VTQRQKRSNGDGSIQKLKGRPGYRAQITLNDGSRPTKQCRNLEEARAWIKDQLFKQHKGELGTARSMTLGEWATTWFITRELKVARKTFKNEQSHFSNHFGWIAKIRLEKLTPGTIEDWITGVENRGLAAKPGVGQPHTVRICHSLLSAMLRDAVSHRLIGVNPMGGVRRPKIPTPAPKYIDRDEIDALLTSCSDLGFAGMRRSG